MAGKPAVLITGASAGIGAVYADRFARRGHDLVLTALKGEDLEAKADRLQGETGVAVDVLEADLTQPAELAQVEARLRDDARIGVLVNNAGAGLRGGFLDQGPEAARKAMAPNFRQPRPAERYRAEAARDRGAARRAAATRPPRAESPPP